MRIGTLKLVQVLRAVPGQPLQAVFYLADVLAALRFTSNSNHIPDDARIASWSEFQCLLPELDEKLGRLPGVRKYTKRGRVSTHRGTAARWTTRFLREFGKRLGGAIGIFA
jgi:hypothetical protein